MSKNSCPYCFNHLCADMFLFNASRPASVISPRDSRSLHLSLLSSVQWLFLRRGDNLWANLPSGSLLFVESIHPKQSASSTISRYGRQSWRGVLDLLQATQQHFSERWFTLSHSLSWLRSVKVNRLVISIHSPILGVKLRVIIQITKLKIKKFEMWRR